MAAAPDCLASSTAQTYPASLRLRLSSLAPPSWRVFSLRHCPVLAYRETLPLSVNTQRWPGTMETWTSCSLGSGEGGDGVKVGKEEGGDSIAGPQSAGWQEDGAEDRRREAGGRR